MNRNCNVIEQLELKIEQLELEISRQRGETAGVRWQLRAEERRAELGAYF